MNQETNQNLGSSQTPEQKLTPPHHKLPRWAWILVLGIVLNAILLTASLSTIKLLRQNIQVELPVHQEKQDVDYSLSEVEGWQTYTNEEYGFEVRYPTDRKVVQYPDVQGVSFLEHDDDMGPGVTIEKLTEQQYRLTYEGSSAEDIKTISESKNTLNGVEWHVIISNNETSKTKTKGYLTLHNGEYFSAHAFEWDFEVLEKMLSTFRFIQDLPEIVVVPNEREVWVINYDGTKARRIFKGVLYGGLDGEASLSPLRNIVAFGTMGDSGNGIQVPGITIVNLENGQVDFFPTKNWHHIFSPEGNFIGYFQDWDKPMSILDLNSKKIVNTIEGLRHEYYGNPSFDWSPDKNSFVYISDLSLYLTDFNNNKIKLVESTGVVRYSTIYGDEDELGQVNTYSNMYSPRFSKDGKHIIYVEKEQNEVDGPVNENLWQIDLDGKNKTKLTDLKDDKNNIFIVGYIENNRKIIYTTYPPEHHQDPNVVWHSYDLNTQQGFVIDEEYGHRNKFISPDGTSLVYYSGTEASASGIYIKSLINAKIKLLAPLPGQVTDWQSGQKTDLIRF